MIKQLLLTVLLGIILLMNVVAQQTGLWTKTISFSTPTHPNQSRGITFYVPSTYSATKKYKLFVALHGQGDSPTNFLNTIKFMTQGIYGNAILVGPSEGTSLSGFSNPAGEDDGILDRAVTEARALYNIDTAFIYITGFSLGARSGLKIGLEDYKKYRGLLLFTPAVQGTNEAKNLTTFKYAYQNGQFIPICMTVGAIDPNGYAAIDAEVQNQLQLVGGKSKLYTIAGLGHNLPQSLSYYTNCYNFIETNVSINEHNDLPLSSVKIYPNPSSDGNFILAVNTNDYRMVDISVKNILGETLYETQNGLIDGQLYLNLSHLSNGIYLVGVKTNEFLLTEKIIIQH